jgi:hypothetical protein
VSNSKDVFSGGFRTLEPGRAPVDAVIFGSLYWPGSGSRNTALVYPF